MPKKNNRKVKIDVQQQHIIKEEYICQEYNTEHIRFSDNHALKEQIKETTDTSPNTSINHSTQSQEVILNVSDNSTFDPDETDNLQDEQNLNINTRFCDIKEKLKNNIFKIALKRGHSKIWNIIGRIENANGEEVKGVVGCRHCFAVLKYDARSTSNLNKHKCYIESQKNSEKISVSGYTKKEAVKFCTEWIVENCRPFRIVKDEGFKKVCEFCVSVGAKYGKNVNMDHLIPDHSTISRNVDKLYQKYFVNIKDMISTMKCGFAITADLWTDNFLRRTYLGVTMHSILQGKLINIVVGVKSLNGDKCTAQNIIAKTQSLLNEFDCQLDLNTIIVTDRGKNMVAAFRDYSRINCVNHLLHNVIQKSVESVTSVADLYKACSKLVNYFKKSGLNAQLSNCLQSFSPTRWNTVYYMFASVGKNWEEIVCILKQNHQINRIDKINHSYVIAMAYILEPFEKASKMLEGAEYPTLHYVLIYIQQLRKKCSINDSDLDIIKDFKLKIIENFESIVLQNLSMLHKVALFLFPPANKLTQFTDDERSSIKLECTKLVEEVYQPSQYTPNNQSVLSAENLDLLGDFLQLNHAENGHESFSQEIARYENSNVCMVDDFNILQWWESRKMQFPNLYNLSCKILCIPASSAPSERIFSYSRQALSETRSVLGKSPEKVHQLIFVHGNVNRCDLSHEINELED